MPSTNNSAFGFFSALPPYLGRKHKLCPLIFAALAEALPRSRWRSSTFVDPFAGGRAVSLYAKAQGFRVVASDIDERSCIVTRALVAYSSGRLTEPDILTLYREPVSLVDTRAASLVPEVFATEQAEWVDRAIANAAIAPEPARSLLQFVIVRTALSLQPMSMLNTTDASAAAAGDYDRVTPRRLGHYLHAPDRLRFETVWKLASAVNRGVFGGHGVALRGDAVELLSATDADVVYLDPPYPGTTRYDNAYEALDHLLADEPPDRPPPDVDELLEASRHAPCLARSYGGTTSLDELITAVARHHTIVRAIEMPYRHLSSLKRKERSNELLIIVRR